MIPYGSHLSARLNTTLLKSPKDAAFLDSCTHHTGAYDSIKISGVTAAQAFAAWYNGNAKQSLWFQDQQYPCKACCNNA